ncbi:Uma2 family endonuclease [Polyangium sp. 15x6]|nr:Uma2 family endonuclease [Polyangium sp. 15x6]MDI3283132.1 Uma2 family endonuclease [Polyangium sp. 15x6]
MGEAARKLVTFAEYIAFEEKAETKHEYRNGEIVAMAGGTLEHGRLTMRVGLLLGIQLEGRPCETFSSDVRVRVLATGLATYPDLSVVCGKLERDPEHENTMTNPVVLVEVLSPSTESYDRGRKFHHYKQIPSLREYVLVSSEDRLIEVFRRNEDGSWSYHDTAETGLAELTSIGCKLDLDEVYHNPLKESA